MESCTFHMSLPCCSISDTQAFYVGVLGGRTGRYASNWIDINLYENQLTFTQTGPYDFQFKSYKFEDEILPAFHYGIILKSESWEILYQKINGHHVEFKCFRDPDQIYRNA